jgi:hypothetical protein
MKRIFQLSLELEMESHPTREAAQLALEGAVEITKQVFPDATLTAVGWRSSKAELRMRTRRANPRSRQRSAEILPPPAGGKAN